MIKCWYCYESGDLTYGTSHLKCNREFWRRQKSGRCTRCGKNPMALGSLWCGSCDENSHYLGYDRGMSTETCVYCGNGGATRFLKAHKECDVEWWIRVEHHKCTMCGKNPSSRRSTRCESCGVDSPYLGYAAVLPKLDGSAGTNQ